MTSPESQTPRPTIDLTGRVAVVTGAGHGIGRAYALELARRGAAVVVNDLGGSALDVGSDADVAERVASEVRAIGGRAVADGGDVADPGAMAAMVQRAVDEFGRLDILVNNAGGAAAGMFDAPERWERAIAVNLYGAVNPLRAAWPVFEAQNYGRVVNTSSSSLLGTPRSGAYAAAKGGVLAITKVLPSTYPDADITVNAVMPIAGTRLFDAVPDPVYRTWMQTHFSPEQVAAFLPTLVDESTTVTGEVFTVGGGRAARVFLETSDGHFDASATAEDYLANWAAVMAGEGRRFARSGQGDLSRYVDLLGDRGPF